MTGSVHHLDCRLVKIVMPMSKIITVLLNACHLKPHSVSLCALAALLLRLLTRWLSPLPVPSLFPGQLRVAPERPGGISGVVYFMWSGRGGEGFNCQQQTDQNRAQGLHQ